MTYFEFLFIFLFLPILGFGALHLWERQRGRKLPAGWLNVAPWLAVTIHVLLALTYTTPWDNYLVATGVWYYDPQLVTGLTIGWVPIEEYTFFVLQPILTGLWLFWLVRRWPSLAMPSQRAEVGRGGTIRLGATLGLGLLWLASLAALLSDWGAATYLGLILVWALPPIMLQTAFGADLLAQRWKLVLLGLLTPTLYLAIVDSLAIDGGTWTIDPLQSFNVFLGGVLPVEEFIFFLITNILITFGITLVQACESRRRGQALFERLPWRRSSNIAANLGHKESCLEP